MLILHGTGQRCPSSPISISLAFVLLPCSAAGAGCSSVLSAGPSGGWLKASLVSLKIHMREGGGIPMHDRKRNKIQELQVKYSLWVPRLSRAVYPSLSSEVLLDRSIAHPKRESSMPSNRVPQNRGHCFTACEHLG